MKDYLTLPATLGIAALLAFGIFSPPGPLAQTPVAGVTALVGARLIDGTGKTPIEQSTVIISDGKIMAAGASSSVKVPPGATLIDAKGKTIIPGIINAHAHLNVDSESQMPVRDQLVQRLQTYALYGVTSAVSLGSTRADEIEGFKLRDESVGALDRARLFTAGLNAIGKTPEEARQSVDRLAGLKADLIKFHINGLPSDMTPDVWGAIIEESQKVGLRTAVHIFYLKDAQAAVAKGVNILAHSIRDQDVPPGFVAELKAKNVAYIPTLTRDLSVFVYETRPAFFDDPFFLRGINLYRKEVDYLSKPETQEKIRDDKQNPIIKAALLEAMKNLKTLSDAGITIALGTDSGVAGNPGRWQGYFEQVELEYMVKSGMTPMQALVAATGGAAKAMKLDQLGRIEAGKMADLVVLDANPLENILNTRKIHSVYVGGRAMKLP
jgi:imidazolonepropionase-like amidohydrolase